MHDLRFNFAIGCRNQCFTDKLSNPVSIFLIAPCSCLDRCGRLQFFASQHPQTLQTPVQYTAQASRCGQFGFQAGIPFMLCKMAVEWNHVHTVRGKQGCIRYCGQMVRIHENLESRLKTETILAQKAGRDGFRTWSGQLFHHVHTQHHLFGRLREVCKTLSGQPCNILAWCAGIIIVPGCKAFRVCRTAIVPHQTHKGFTQRSLTVSRSCTIQQKKALIAGISRQGIA